MILNYYKHTPACVVINPVNGGGPRQLSRYSDSLRAGRSGDRIPVGPRFSAPVQTGPGAYPASCTTGTGSFPGVKLPVRGADHPPPSKCGGHERVGLYLYSPSGPSWPVIGRTFTFTFTFITDHSKTWSVRLRTKLLEKLHMNSLAPTNNAPADAFTCNSVERLPVYEPVNSFVCPTLRYLTTPRTDNIM